VEARRVLRQADIAARAARHAGGDGIGRLRVGYLPDAIPRHVPQTLARYAAAAPGIEVVLEAGAPLRLAADVRNGSLDLAVVCVPLASGGLRVSWLGEEPGVVALPASHPLVSAPALGPRELQDAPLLLLPRTANPAFYDGVISAWRAAGLTASPREAREPRVEHALLAVAAGAGLTVLPASAADRHSLAGVRFVPFAAPLGCEVAIFSRNEDSTTIAAFLRIAAMTARAAQRSPARAGVLA
jgi:DNA-binding transcriptional LysR family regulator